MYQSWSKKANLPNTSSTWLLYKECIMVCTTKHNSRGLIRFQRSFFYVLPTLARLCKKTYLIWLWGTFKTDIWRKIFKRDPSPESSRFIVRRQATYDKSMSSREISDRKLQTSFQASKTLQHWVMHIGVVLMKSIIGQTWKKPSTSKMKKPTKLLESR